METVPLCVGEGRYVPESWGLHLQLVLLHLVQAGDDHARQGKQRNDVGQDDQVIEHVGKLPDEVAAGDGAQEDEHQRDDGIDEAAQLANTEPKAVWARLVLPRVAVMSPV